MLVDGYAPELDFGEAHSVWLSALPGRTLEQAQKANLGEMPLVRLLFAVRSVQTRHGGIRGLPFD